jgi:hypothetical protein
VAAGALSPSDAANTAVASLPPLRLRRSLPDLTAGPQGYMGSWLGKVSFPRTDGGRSPRTTLHPEYQT